MNRGIIQRQSTGMALSAKRMKAHTLNWEMQKKAFFHPKYPELKHYEEGNAIELFPSAGKPDALEKAYRGRTVYVFDNGGTK